MLEATKVRISCIAKKVNRTTYKISYTKRVNSEVSGSLTLSLCKNVQKGVLHVQRCFLLIRPTTFLAVFVAVAT